MDVDHPSERRWLVAILVVAAVLRVGFGWWAVLRPTSLIVNGDAYGYYAYGKSLAAGHGYTNILTGKPTAYYPVGYPAILAVLFWIVQHTPIPDDLPRAATMLNAVLGTASVALVYVIARRILRPTAALVAAALVAVWPNLVYYTASTQLETTFTFLALATVAVAVTHDWTTGPPSRNRLLVFGLVLGVCAEVRPFALPFLLGLGLTALVAGLGWRSALLAMGWAVVPVVLVLIPWTVRNQVQLHSPVVFSTNMGDTICIDRAVGATGAFRFAAAGCSPKTDEVARNADNTARAIGFVREHPAREARQIVTRARLIFSHDNDGIEAVEAGTHHRFLGHRVRTVLDDLGDWWFYAVGAVAMVGVVVLARGPRPERTLVLTAIVTLLGIPLVLWGNTRFHVPLLPFAAIAAAAPVRR